MRRITIAGIAAALGCSAAVVAGPSAAPALAATAPHRIDHIVVIYEENHSFDNLYGQWGDVKGQHVRGLADATPSQTTQLGQDGRALTCLYQNDVNLTSPTPLSTTCTDTAHPAKQGSPATAQTVNSRFPNAPFLIDDYIKPSDTTCPAPGAFAANGVAKGSGQPGGCTEDLVHRFYQEQYQVDGGKQNRYVAGSDAAGLVMGHYATGHLPVYRYLHGAGAPKYVLADNFFQAAWGGSFLNHQLLVSAQAPLFRGADSSGRTTGCATGTANCDLHAVVDANGMPNSAPYYTPTAAVKDQQLTVAADADGACAPSFPGAATRPTGTLCGDYAVNTIQPFTQPYPPGTQVGKMLPLLHSANIGDSLSTKNVSWSWYSGGWDNAVGNNGRDVLHPLGAGWTNGTGPACDTSVTTAKAVFPNCPDKSFQFHHQPLGYFANYADGTVGRVEHLKDEQQFLLDAKKGNLPAVSFVKPVGAENEHPGYAAEHQGSDHLVELLETIRSGPQAPTTMVVVTYDEFGGQWDHVAPPGTAANPGIHDVYGPGSRVPALVIDPGLPASGVDHTPHDTTSVLSTIEHRFGLAPLTDPSGKKTRDAYVADLFSAYRVNAQPCGAGNGAYGCGSHQGPGGTSHQASRTLTTDAQGLVRTPYRQPARDFGGG
jgi:acid phosphatase